MNPLIFVLFFVVISVTKRPLSHEDFEVESIARVCEDVDRGNDCKLDGDGMSFTCYTTCTEELCNVKVSVTAMYNHDHGSKPANCLLWFSF